MTCGESSVRCAVPGESFNARANARSDTGGRVTDPSTEPLRKEIHEAEREIDALECKIQFADLKTTYPHEYAEMRSEQEKHRQHILKCLSILNEQVASERTADHGAPES
jgi:hypothetical protein